MRKIYMIFLFLLFLCPVYGMAEENFCDIVADDEVKIGDTIKVDLAFDFKDAVNVSSDYGIYMVAFEIDYDETIFDIVDITTKANWDESVYLSNGKYYGLAIYGNPESDSVSTYRGKYIMRLSLLVKNTSKKETTFSIKEYGAMLIDKNVRYYSDLKNTDIKQIEEQGNIFHTFKIKEGVANNNSTSSIVEKKDIDIKSEIKKDASTINNKAANNQKKEETNVSDDNKDYNNYLKLLEIEGYKIDFNKHQSIYSIEVDKNVNSLNIKAECESNKSTVKINGADNLEKAKDKVTIDVTSGKKETKTYIINIKRIEEKEDNSDAFSINISENQKKIIIIFVSCVLGIGLIIFIIIKVRDRKVEKNIDKW